MGILHENGSVQRRKGRELGMVESGNRAFHLPAVTKVLSSTSWADFKIVEGRESRRGSEFEWDGAVSGVISSCGGTSGGWTGFGV